MKLLFDQNISFRLVQELNSFYPDSRHVGQIKLEMASDQEIWEYARKNDFVIVTQDSDFNERSLVYGYPPKILWIRTGNTHTENIKNLLIQNHPAISGFEKDREIGCLEIF